MAIDSMQVVDVDTKHHRVTAVGRFQNEVIFGLAVRRMRPTGHYWCFYMSLDRSQFTVLNRLWNENEENPGFTFLGISSDTISAPRSVVDKFVLPQPDLWVGIDVAAKDVGVGTVDELTAFLISFCESILDMLGESV